MLRFNLYTQEFSHCLFDFSNIHDNLVSLPNVITQCFLWGDYLLVPDLPSCSKNMRPENALLVVRDIRSSSDDVLTSFWTATEECHEDGIWGRRTYGSEYVFLRTAYITFIYYIATFPPNVKGSCRFIPHGWILVLNR
jgi:hypothetical protein